MNYWFVEYARAVRALRIAAILLGIFLAITIILRLSVHDGHWEARLEGSPTAHVSRTNLPNGSQRVVVDDPQQQTHAVIVKHPGGAYDMDVTEPRGHHHAEFIMGNSSMVSVNVKGNRTHTRLHYVPETPTFDLGILFLVTILMGLIVASILAGPLAKENDGHLEIAWTKPVSRERYALESIAVDAIAIVLAQLLTIFVALLATLMFFVPRFAYGPNMGWEIVFAIAAPIVWYALLTAASASLKRGPGMVVGLGWVAALLVPGLAGALQGAATINVIAAWFYAIFHALAYIDPLSYLAFNKNQPVFMPFPNSVGMFCILIAVYVALAVAQWRRVEA
jgi:hypothetical protein